MIVLGYNGFSRSAGLFARLYGHTADSIDRHCVLGHDAGAALFIDGALVAAVEEERMNRLKKTSAFPSGAINWCLGQAGISFADVDYFALGWNFDDVYASAAISEIASAAADAEGKFQALSALGETYMTVNSRSAVLRDFIDGTGYELPGDRLVCVPHHLAHLGCGMAFAGSTDAAFFVSDGKSERNSSIMGEIREGKLTVFDHLTVDDANSVALMYQNITRYLGFAPNNDEYKVMGLAGFGTPSDASSNPLLREAVALQDNGRFTLTLPKGARSNRAYRELFDELFGGNDSNRETFDFRVRVATAAQQMVEVVTAHQLRALAGTTGLRSLIFEGGLALNCVNNTRLLEELPFERIDVSCGASDPGISIGAAAYVVTTRAGARAIARSPYLGPEYRFEDVHRALEPYSQLLRWEQLTEDEIVRRTAQLLAGKVVVGWFQGRAEYGPRALGNRSILANPSFPDMKDIINNRVKHREPFRPFAPIVLEHDARRIFEMGKKETSPFMTFVFPVRPEFREAISAATHVDGTSRIQTVADDTNPLLARLLREFTAQTGVPCLVNTSFNVAGEPIVCAPLDAINCFLGTDIDYLVMGTFLIAKR